MLLIFLLEFLGLHVCHGQGCRVLLGINSSHLKNRNPYNGYIYPYGLMSLSPIIWEMSWEWIDLVLGMGDIPPLIGILIMAIYIPLRTWVAEFIPYYMEIMGVDRPDRTCVFSKFHDKPFRTGT